MSELRIWPGLTVITVTKGTEEEVLETALPLVEEASTTEPEIGVTPEIVLLEMLNSKAGIEDPGPTEDGSTGEDADDDAGVEIPEDPDSTLDPGADAPVD